MDTYIVRKFQLSTSSRFGSYSQKNENLDSSARKNAE